MIFALIMRWFHSGYRRRRKVPSSLDRIASTALLDASVKNPKVLARVINKYGEIQVSHEDKIETEIENVSNEIYRKAAQTIINSRRQELDSLIAKIIDRVIGPSVTGRSRYE